MIAHYLTAGAAWFAALSLTDQLCAFTGLVLVPIAWGCRPKGGR